MNTFLNKKQLQFGFFTGVFIISLLAAIYSDLYYIITIPFFLLLCFSGWQHARLLFFLLLFTLPLSFEYNFSETLATDFPDELLMLLVSCLFFFYWVHSPQSIPKNTWQHPLLLLLMAVLLWTIVTVLFSSQIIISFKYLLAKGWYIGAFVIAPLIILRQKENIKIMANVMGVSMLLVTIIALLRHSNYGFQFANINNAVTPFFRNHVNYSAMMVCVIPLFFAFAKLNQSKRLKTYIRLAIILLLTALFFSYARGAWLALAAGLITYLLIKKKYLVFAYFIVIVFLSGFLFWIKSNDHYLQFRNDYNTTIFHKDFREHLIATYQLKDVSTAERFYRWIAGVRMIKDSWLTGYGPNTFYNNYRSYASPAFKTWVSNNEDHSSVHNYFLLTAIEQGIPGLLLLIIFFGSILYYAQHLYHRIEDLFYKTVSITAGVIMVMILVVNFLSDLIETDKIGTLFFLCISALVMTDINTRLETKKNLSGFPDIKSIS